VLARLFARPTNVLVMDEPTNDLDIETLELLEELLQDYAGTVLIVSHDREFLNNVITQTLAAEGNGVWREYVGGYDEWLAQRPQPATATTPEIKKEKTEAPVQTRARPAKTSRITSWEQRELDEMPEAIANIEARQQELTAALADGNLYRDSPGEVERINRELAELEEKMSGLFERWEALEAKQKG